MLRLPGPLLRRGQQAAPLQPEGQLQGGAGHGGRVMGPQPTHGVRARLHGHLRVGRAAGVVQVNVFLYSFLKCALKSKKTVRMLYSMHELQNVEKN